MHRLPIRSAVVSVAFICLVASSAWGDSFSFSGTATFGGDTIDFFLSGPSFSLFSAAPSGPAGLLATCDQGTTCEVPGQEVIAWPSFDPSLGGGEVGGVTAEAVRGSLLFSGTSFTVTGTEDELGSGPVTFTGELMGFRLSPSGGLGPMVFDLILSGTGTVTALGQDIGGGQVGIDQFHYNFTGTASGTVATVPEPSSLLLVSSGLAGIGWIRRRCRSRMIQS
jgi:hypothetical protein